MLQSKLTFVTFLLTVRMFHSSARIPSILGRCDFTPPPLAVRLPSHLLQANIMCSPVLYKVKWHLPLSSIWMAALQPIISLPVLISISSPVSSPTPSLVSLLVFLLTFPATSLSCLGLRCIVMWCHGGCRWLVNVTWSWLWLVHQCQWLRYGGQCRNHQHGMVAVVAWTSTWQGG